MFETVFICRKLEELKPDLTTTAHFAIQLSYPMSNLQHFLQARAGGLFVLIKGMGINVERSGWLAKNKVHSVVPPHFSLVGVLMARVGSCISS